MALVLIITCAVTPIRIAFYTTDGSFWILINYIIDILFALDIIIIFNTAFYDDDFQIVD